MKIAKRALALIFVLILSINSFGAISSDNDGSSFITKAEFDSLKNQFQAQLDTFNQGIDSKIDQAIAAYLVGIQLATSETKPIFDGAGAKVVLLDSKRNKGYKIAKPSLKYWLSRSLIEKYGGTGPNIGGSLQMQRETPSKGEIFRLVDDKFKYYSKEWSYNIAITFTYNSWCSAGEYPPSYAPNLYVRWQATYSTKLTNWTDDAAGKAAWNYGSHKPSIPNYFMWSCSGVWFDAFYPPFETNWNDWYRMQANETIGERIIYALDATNETNVDNLKCTVLNLSSSDEQAFKKCLDDSKTDGWDTTDGIWEKSYPDQAGITSKCYFAWRAGMNPDESKVKTMTNVNWVGEGSYNAYSTSRPTNPSRANKWHEPLATLSKKTA